MKNPVKSFLKSEERDSRTLAIETLYREGKTLQEIGGLFGITRERVRQILDKKAITYKDGGAHVKYLSRCVQREQASIKSAEINCQKIYLCSKNELADCNAKLGKNRGVAVMKMYRQHRKHSFKEKVVWNLPYPVYCEIIKPFSNERFGRGKNNFVLRRKNGLDGFTVDNVEVTTLSKAIQLTRQQSKMLKLYRGGMGPTEIAKKLNLAMGTVQVTLHNAKTRLAVMAETNSAETR